MPVSPRSPGLKLHPASQRLASKLSPAGKAPPDQPGRQSAVTQYNRVRCSATLLHIQGSERSSTPSLDGLGPGLLYVFHTPARHHIGQLRSQQHLKLLSEGGGPNKLTNEIPTTEGRGGPACGCMEARRTDSIMRVLRQHPHTYDSLLGRLRSAGEQPPLCGTTTQRPK